MENLYEKAIDGILESGYAVCDGFLPDQLVSGLRDTLTEHYREGEFKKAGIGKGMNYQKDLEIRSDKIFWINNQSENPIEMHFLSIVNGFVNYLNRTCFTGIQSYEFHYAVYPKGSFYKRHLDQFNNDPGRQYTMIFYLNDNWKPEDGGQLTLYLKSGEVEILPEAGKMIFFESNKIEHEVKIAHRQRLSVTGWLKNVAVSVPVP